MRTYDWNHNKDCPISKPELSDFEVANMVRMLMRSDLNHEMVCTLGRDRIMCLVKEKKQLEKELADLKEKYRWRDVGEELPGHMEYVSCLNNYGKNLCAYWDEREQFFIDYQDNFRDVTHWMPLPQPDSEVEG